MAAAHSRGAFVRRWSLRVIWSLTLVFATVVIGGALDATRRLPDLQPWHRIVPADAGVRTLTNSSTLADYLAIEERAFRTVRERIEDTLDPAWKLPANRYNRDGYAHPSRFGVDWNRTQILSPEVEPVGGALLVHGLTDAPYALRSIGQDLRQRGYYVVVLRVPDAIEKRIAHPHVRRSHVNLRAKRARAIRKLAGFHARKQVDILLNRTSPER